MAVLVAAGAVLVAVIAYGLQAWRRARRPEGAIERSRRWRDTSGPQ